MNCFYPKCLTQKFESRRPRVKFLMPAVTNYHELGGLKQHTLSSSSADQKPEVCFTEPKARYQQSLQASIVSFLFQFLDLHSLVYGLLPIFNVSS